jgi:chromosome segregation ATPase
MEKKNLEGLKDLIVQVGDGAGGLASLAIIMKKISAGIEAAYHEAEQNLSVVNSEISEAQIKLEELTKGIDAAEMALKAIKEDQDAEIKKQKDDFDRIMVGETTRVNAKEKLADRTMEEAEKMLSDNRQRANELKELEDNAKKATADAKGMIEKYTSSQKTLDSLVEKNKELEASLNKKSAEQGEKEKVLKTSIDESIKLLAECNAKLEEIKTATKENQLLEETQERLKAENAKELKKIEDREFAVSETEKKQDETREILEAKKKNLSDKEVNLKAYEEELRIYASKVDFKK